MKIYVISSYEGVLMVTTDRELAEKEFNKKNFDVNCEPEHSEVWEDNKCISNNEFIKL